MTSRVHCAATEAPRENSSEARARRVTAMSWLPARQTAACARAQLHAGVGIGAVADEVAQAPELVEASLDATASSVASKACLLACMSEITATFITAG